VEQIFYNGKIITMKESNAQEALDRAPEAVLIKNGIIIQTGEIDTITKMASKEVVFRNLEGRCLMPSFIDTHSHFVMNGQMSTWANLSDCESFEEIIGVLTDYIEKNNITEDGVVLGYGYDHNFLKERQQPDKTVLDKVSNKIPIFILHISAHLGCANSAALQLAGIDETTEDPQSGKIGRVGESNIPSGYLEEAGINILQQVILPKAVTDYTKNLKKMQDIYLENGITTAQDGASTESDISFLIKMSELCTLKLDIVAYPLMPAHGLELMEKYGAQYKSYVNRFRIGGYKLVLDGSPQGRSAWMSKPYVGGEANYCGYPWLNDEDIENYLRQAVNQKQQVLAHCNGDAACEQFIVSYDKVIKEDGCNDNLRPVMIHCQTVRNDQLDRMAKLKMIASVFIGHVWYWGDVHIKNFGLERGNYISPVKDALDRDVKVTFHQDTPVTKPNMLHSIWCAVNRVSRGGNIIGDDQVIDAYDALKAVTISAAYQYFEENNKGTIEEGKRADLVILDKSPLETDKMHIKDIKVLETIKDGKTVYSQDFIKQSEI